MLQVEMRWKCLVGKIDVLWFFFISDVTNGGDAFGAIPYVIGGEDIL